jgi:hypothetical protein
MPTALILALVSWLEDRTKPMIGRVWQAFLGIGHTMELRICTDPHAYAAWVGRGQTVQIDKVAPHVDLRLRVWNKRGPDVTIIAWQMPDLTETYTITGYPKEDLVLERFVSSSSLGGARAVAVRPVGMPSAPAPIIAVMAAPVGRGCATRRHPSILGPKLPEPQPAATYLWCAIPHAA